MVVGTTVFIKIAVMMMCCLLCMKLMNDVMDFPGIPSPRPFGDIVYDVLRF
jgi:hypothetical protein